MTEPKARAMIGHHADGKCIAGFTVGRPAFTDFQKFPSERHARQWIAQQATDNGLTEEDIAWIPPESRNA